MLSITTPPEEDRATATGNMPRWRSDVYSFEDMIAVRQTHTQRQRDTLVTILRSCIGGGVTSYTMRWQGLQTYHRNASYDLHHHRPPPTRTSFQCICLVVLICTDHYITDGFWAQASLRAASTRHLNLLRRFAAPIGIFKCPSPNDRHPDRPC